MGKCLVCRKSPGFFSFKNTCDECTRAEQKTDKDQEREQGEDPGAPVGNLPHYGSTLLLNEEERQLA